jgi:hypothetical protein
MLLFIRLQPGLGKDLPQACPYIQMAITGSREKDITVSRLKGVVTVFDEEYDSEELVRMDKTVNFPVELYESMSGRYFTAQTPRLIVGGNTNAWGALINPYNSDVILHVNVTTLNFIYGEPLTLGFYMNAELPGRPRESDMIAPANTAIRPLPEPEVHLLYESDVPGYPRGGEFTLSRTAYPGQLTMLQKNGIFIVPPGGSYCAFVRPLERGQDESKIYLAFGWWEEPV